MANIEGRIKIEDIFKFSMARALTKYDLFYSYVPSDLKNCHNFLRDGFLLCHPLPLNRSCSSHIFKSQSDPLDTYMFGKPWSYLLGCSKCKSHGKNGCSIKEENPEMKFWIFLGILALHQPIGESCLCHCIDIIFIKMNSNLDVLRVERVVWNVPARNGHTYDHKHCNQYTGKCW